MKPYYDEGGITIYHGDCLTDCPEAHDHLGDYFLGTLAADVLFTDPPYGIGWRRGVNHARSSKAHSGIANDSDTSVRDIALDTVRGLPGVVFGSFYAPFPANLKQILVWPKPADAGVVGSTTGFRRDVEPIFLVGPWPIRSVAWSALLRPGARGIAATASETGHPHTKPLGLVADLIDKCPPGTILDPFLGSGTTLVAAKLLGRKAIGIEIEERYCEIAAKRLAQEVLPLEVAA